MEDMNIFSSYFDELEKVTFQPFEERWKIHFEWLSSQSSISNEFSKSTALKHHIGALSISDSDRSNAYSSTGASRCNLANPTSSHFSLFSTSIPSRTTSLDLPSFIPMNTTLFGRLDAESILPPHPVSSSCSSQKNTGRSKPKTVSSTPRRASARRAPQPTIQQVAPESEQTPSSRRRSSRIALKHQGDAVAATPFNSESDSESESGSSRHRTSQSNRRQSTTKSGSSSDASSSAEESVKPQATPGRRQKKPAQPAAPADTPGRRRSARLMKSSSESNLCKKAAESSDEEESVPALPSRGLPAFNPRQARNLNFLESAEPPQQEALPQIPEATPVRRSTRLLRSHSQTTLPPMDEPETPRTTRKNQAKVSRQSNPVAQSEDEGAVKGYRDSSSGSESNRRTSTRTLRSNAKVEVELATPRRSSRLRRTEESDQKPEEVEVDASEAPESTAPSDETHEEDEDQEQSASETEPVLCKEVEQAVQIPVAETTEKCQDEQTPSDSQPDQSSPVARKTRSTRGTRAVRQKKPAPKRAGVQRVAASLDEDPFPCESDVAAPSTPIREEVRLTLLNPNHPLRKQAATLAREAVDWLADRRARLLTEVTPIQCENIPVLDTATSSFPSEEIESHDESGDENDQSEKISTSPAEKQIEIDLDLPVDQDSIENLQENDIEVIETPVEAIELPLETVEAPFWVQQVQLVTKEEDVSSEPLVQSTSMSVSTDSPLKITTEHQSLVDPLAALPESSLDVTPESSLDTILNNSLERTPVSSACETLHESTSESRVHFGVPLPEPYSLGSSEPVGDSTNKVGATKKIFGNIRRLTPKERVLKMRSARKFPENPMMPAGSHVTAPVSQHIEVSVAEPSEIDKTLHDDIAFTTPTLPSIASPLVDDWPVLQTENLAESSVEIESKPEMASTPEEIPSRGEMTCNTEEITTPLEMAPQVSIGSDLWSSSEPTTTTTQPGPNTSEHRDNAGEEKSKIFESSMASECSFAPELMRNPTLDFESSLFCPPCDVSPYAKTVSVEESASPPAPSVGGRVREILLAAEHLLQESADLLSPSKPSISRADVYVVTPSTAPEEPPFPTAAVCDEAPFVSSSAAFEAPLISSQEEPSIISSGEMGEPTVVSPPMDGQSSTPNIHADSLLHIPKVTPLKSPMQLLSAYCSSMSSDGEKSWKSPELAKAASKTVPEQEGSAVAYNGSDSSLLPKSKALPPMVLFPFTSYNSPAKTASPSGSGASKGEPGEEGIGFLPPPPVLPSIFALDDLIAAPAMPSEPRDAHQHRPTEDIAAKASAEHAPKHRSSKKPAHGHEAKPHVAHGEKGRPEAHKTGRDARGKAQEVEPLSLLGSGSSKKARPGALTATGGSKQRPSTHSQRHSSKGKELGIKEERQSSGAQQHLQPLTIPLHRSKLLQAYLVPDWAKGESLQQALAQQEKMDSGLVFDEQWEAVIDLEEIFGADNATCATPLQPVVAQPKAPAAAAASTAAAPAAASLKRPIPNTAGRFAGGAPRPNPAPPTSSSDASRPSGLKQASRRPPTNSGIPVSRAGGQPENKVGNANPVVVKKESRRWLGLPKRTSSVAK